MLAVAVTEAVKSSSSSSEISTTPLGSAFDSGPARAREVISSVLTEVSSFPFFMTLISSCEDTRRKTGSRTKLQATPRGKMEVKP